MDVPESKLQFFILRDVVGIVNVLHNREPNKWFFYCHSHELSEYANLLTPHQSVLGTSAPQMVEQNIYRIEVVFNFPPKITWLEESVQP
jgi:hypothetical protein